MDIKHCLAEEDIDALAAAAHGFVGADLAAVCDEAAMAALRRIIASKKQLSAEHPSRLPRTHSLATESQVFLNKQCPAWSDAQIPANNQQVSSPQCKLAPAKPMQQAGGTPPKASLTEHAPDTGVASSSEDTSSCLQRLGSTSARAKPSGKAEDLAPAASGACEWQVRHCKLALTMQFPPWQGSLFKQPKGQKVWSTGDVG